MIIDFNQRKESMLISFVNEKREIELVENFLKNGYFNYVECDEDAPDKLDIKSFNNKFIRKQEDKYFKYHNVNEYFTNIIKDENPILFDKLSQLRIPKVYSFDLETDIKDETGYSTPELAENPIRSISITDENLQTILFKVKNPKHPKITDTDILYIDGIIKESLVDYYDKYDVNYKVYLFDTEIEMLAAFIDGVNKYFHLLIGWNIYGWDIEYFNNRCIRLGIDSKKMSPTNKFKKKQIKINQDTTLELRIPEHRLFVDYMFLTKESLIYNNLGSYSLDYCSELILGLNKVSYKGNLRKLYEDDYLRYIAYSLIDTILVMLIDKKTNFLSTEFFQAYYCNLPFTNISQNTISDALIYNELLKTNQFLLESERYITEKRAYKGGYVKTPTKKITNASMGYDFASLYPSAMITMGLSPDAKIDSINVDETGFPLTKEDEIIWQKYKSEGCSLSPEGRIYKMDKEYLYTRIEKSLLTERSIFKGYMESIYLDLIPKIENQINKIKNNNK